MYDRRIYVFYDLILLTLEYGKKLNSKEKKMLINQDKIMTKKTISKFFISGCSNRGRALSSHFLPMKCWFDKARELVTYKPWY